MANKEKHHYKNNDRVAGQWNNVDNNIFYSAIKPSGLRALAEKAGLLSGCDVKLLNPYWKDSNTILDVCSGFGRVIEALLKYGFKGNITSIERNDTQYDYLSQHYSHQVNVLHCDVYELSECQEVFDVILLLWSGLADFSVAEQPKVIGILSNLMKKDGVLIVDTMPMNVQPLDTEVLSQQSFLTRHANTTVCTYEPNSMEMERYANQHHLVIKEKIGLQTDTKRTRWLYVLKKH